MDRAEALWNELGKPEWKLSAIASALIAEHVDGYAEGWNAAVVELELPAPSPEAPPAKVDLCPHCKKPAADHDSADQYGCGWPLSEPVAPADPRDQRIVELEAAIRWACGEEDEFPTRQPGQGAYWWRTELRRRAALADGEGSPG